ncbi:MAG: DUF2891 domain-containing protein [Pseudomonadota bacterium]
MEPRTHQTMALSIEDANNLIKLPISCATQEYPNKLNQVLKNADDLRSPRDLHPAFFGCFDWHSSVHGFWSMTKLLKAEPSVGSADKARQLLRTTITSQNITAEVEYFEDNPTWERPYGWAWLLKLQLELDTWDDPLAKELAPLLRPLANRIADLYLEYLPKLVYPIRVGEHTNTAFGLAFAWDYAKAKDHQSLLSAISDRARSYYLNDRNCPIEWEPSGYDFLSPCLEEVDLMRRVLDPQEFRVWIKNFMPQLTDNDYQLEVGIVSDRSDGKLVHLDGLNFSRAWVLYGLAHQYPEYGHLIKIANTHVRYSLPNLVGDGYEGGHWLASFAIHALDNTDGGPRQ